MWNYYERSLRTCCHLRASDWLLGNKVRVMVDIPAQYMTSGKETTTSRVIHATCLLDNEARDLSIAPHIHWGETVISLKTKNRVHAFVHKPLGPQAILYQFSLFFSIILSLLTSSSRHHFDSLFSNHYLEY